MCSIMVCNLSLMFERIEDLLVEDELLDTPDEWESLDVDYHPPHVERLYMRIGSVQISLHRIYPCDPEEALLHPHPWPSSFKIYQGQYFTKIGYSSTAEPPSEFTSGVMAPGSMLRMSNPNEWHMVAPLGDGPTYTMMVTSVPYSEEEVNPGCKKASKKLSPLSFSQKSDMLNEFKQLIENVYNQR